MSIENYQNMLMEIKDKILNKELKYKNTIIVGDNSSGKSEVLRQLLINQEKGYYFIDSVNRSFNYENVSNSDDLDETYKSVVKYRLSENNFNLVDSFDLYKTGIGAIENVYFNYYQELKRLLKSFLEIDFKITIKKDEIIGERKVLDIGKGIVKLSSGYQAIIRLFLELIYFEDSLEATVMSPVVVIDEVNEFLSAKNEEKILPFITNRFSSMSFIVTTHSADVIASSIDCNILVLCNDDYECLDGNDFSSVTDVREIFSKVYNLSNEDETQGIEVILRHLLNAKISETWTKIEEEKLRNINKTILSNSQRLILNQIVNWL
ncbi:AAA family ATPase [Clostridium algidicarnis]|uniref:AAA family ATPase n=1 Tax=Clostridium algidicarnis TaxID=37659 RepID=UPI001C0AC087|nr:AAA family ATPase [Clostridium algidicarnis]MBU3203608.1 ATP-binding protein [Clostridium algidicarnis]MBU3211762.1 ATP-binding protein [Clostridium algidicarnis]MBU3221731.1 ATP-binding protein [Clostridium algidicarnis]